MSTVVPMVLGSVYFCLSTVGLLLNSLFLLIFCKSSKMRKSSFFKLACSLAISDSLQLSLYLVYFAPRSLIGGNFPKQLEFIPCAISNFGWYTGTATLVLQSFNRFVAVWYPHLLETIYSLRTCRFLIVLAWTIGAIMVTPNLFPSGYISWETNISAMLYLNPRFGFIDIGYTCPLLILIYVLHALVFKRILAHDSSITHLKSMRKKRETRQFVQFFIITLFPVMYEISANALPPFVSDDTADLILAIFNTTTLIANEIVNATVYLIANETVKEELRTAIPVLKIGKFQLNLWSTEWVPSKAQPENVFTGTKSVKQAWKPR